MRNRKIWVFNAANFSGNPKWLFIYVNKHRKDIKAYWFCLDEKTAKNIKMQGYNAYTWKSSKYNLRSRYLLQHAGVFVVNQVKEVIPEFLKGALLLNLWHGVGCKYIERARVDFGFLEERIVKKYIKNNLIYRNKQLFLVTSPMMEQHFKDQCGLDDDKIIRAGYPCCVHDRDIATYDHDILLAKGRDKNTKIFVYAPTYRETSPFLFFGKAIPDMNRLIEKLKENNLLLIFKMHPLAEQDYFYVLSKKSYQDSPYLLFWDNANDIYEVFDQIYAAIVDYSSIFYDMLAANIPHFIRYFFDFEDTKNIRKAAFDYEEMTSGVICKDFDSLLNCLNPHVGNEDLAERRRIHDLFWAYSDSSAMEKIVKSALEYQETTVMLPQLHSFDVFDTLLHRRGLLPNSIFFFVRFMMERSEVKFPRELVKDYPRIRQEAEANVREFKKKAHYVHDDGKIEIQFDEIFHHLTCQFNLTVEQASLLRQWELEAEFNDCMPDKDRLEEVRALLDAGNRVILISDMYLQENFIKMLLQKVDPSLAQLPLFLSSTWGVQKTTKKLFIKAYAEINYDYEGWVHHGDNPKADGSCPKALSIKTKLTPMLAFNPYEKKLLDSVNSYDGFLIAAMLARFRAEKHSRQEILAYCYASLILVPYIDWVVQDAMKRGIQTLYFIARDGHYLKSIADQIIESRNVFIKTKYIYGSRSAWRVPSFIESIDDEFWSNFGNFNEILCLSSLLDALSLTEKQFDEFFPDLSHYKAKVFTKLDLSIIVARAKASESYKKYLLELAWQKRKTVCAYLRQEINFSENLAFVEFWGRGYTQTCLRRLIQCVCEREMDVAMYYMRSIYPSQGHDIRYSFTTCPASLIWVEAIFANLPYGSTTGYYLNDGSYEALYPYNKCDENLFHAMEKMLVRFVHDYCNLSLTEPEITLPRLTSFEASYVADSGHKDPNILKCIGSLRDKVSVYGNRREYAPALTFRSAASHVLRTNPASWTNSKKMSLARSSKTIKLVHKMYYKYINKSKFLRKIINYCKKYFM